jgi:hypothetical protein
MNKQQLTNLLSILDENAALRTPDCPGDHEIAAGVAGQLPAQARGQFQRHVADCDFCIRQVGLLSRLHEVEPDQSVSEFLLARARRMGGSNTRPTIRYAPRWAVAAVVVLAVTFAMNWDLLTAPAPEVTSAGSPGPVSPDTGPQQSRNLNSRLGVPQVLAPANGATIDPDSLVFQWSEVPDSLFYDVRIVTDEGDLIWQERVEDTKLGLPGHLQLKPGSEYFVQVDAYLAAAKSISSRHVPFTVKEQR